MVVRARGQSCVGMPSSFAKGWSSPLSCFQNLQICGKAVHGILPDSPKPWPCKAKMQSLGLESFADFQDLLSSESVLKAHLSLCILYIVTHLFLSHANLKRKQISSFVTNNHPEEIFAAVLKAESCFCSDSRFAPPRTRYLTALLLYSRGHVR